MTEAITALSRSLASGLAVAGLFGLAGADDADAQQAQPTTTPTPTSSDGAIALPQVTVQGDRTGNANDHALDLPRMPATVRETPQTVNVVPQELLQQQQVTTLGQALRNVPGITISTGEGNGGLNGDQFRIRGLQARGDIYVNGLHDFGNYYRDVFNTESVEVIKGPSGQYFGAGNVGGIINQTLKQAHLGDDNISLDQSFGSGPLFRGTADGNYQINDTSAVRLNLMYNQQDTPGRNNVTTNRYGAAIDLGLGLGTNTTWHFNYQFLHSDGTPDYGVSMIQYNGIYRPITSLGLPRNVTYTRNFDFDWSDIHMLTSNLSSKVTDWLTLSNDTRLSFYDRDYTATTPGPCSGACATSFLLGGNPTLPYGAGGGTAYQQSGWGIENVAMGRANFHTGPFRHQLTAGVDVSYNNDDRTYGTFVNRVNNQTIRYPQFNYPNTYLTWPSSGYRNADATDVGFFAGDRLWFTPEVSLFGTLRWDAFDSTFCAPGLNRQQQSADRISPSISLMYEPFSNTTFYATFSRSYKPVGTDVSSLVDGSTTSADVTQSGSDLSPERSDLYEVGGKVDVLDGRLGLSGSLFRIQKENSFTYDQNGDIVLGFSDAGTGRSIHGVELGVSGQLAKGWQIFAAYAYMEGIVTNSATYGGKDAPQVPHNNFSVWTTYDITDLVLEPGYGSLKVGGGVQYASRYWTDVANTYQIPYFFSFDTMVQYQIEKYRFSFNAYNLTDQVNYASAFSGRAVPAPGRTFLFNLGLTF